MKLNNNGWGMKEMIMFMSILLLFLLLAVFNVSRLYKSIEKTEHEKNIPQVVDKKEDEGIVKPEDKGEEKVESTDEAYYAKLEKKFQDATYEYIKDYHYDLSSHILNVSYDTLKGLEYLDMLDQFDKPTCDGYSNVFYDEETGEYSVKSFIRCGNYTSVGY